MLVLIIILALIILLANLYAAVDVKYIDEELHYCIRYSFFKILSNDKKPEKKRNKKKLFLKKIKKDKNFHNNKKSSAASKTEKISEDKKEYEISEDKKESEISETEKISENKKEDGNTYDTAEELFDEDIFGEDLYEEDAKKKKKKNKKSSDKNDNDNDDGKQSLSDKIEKAEAIIDFVRSSEKHVVNLVKNIRFSDINIDFTIAENDAYDCAIRYGMISAGIYNILGFISSYFKTAIDKVNIGLKYNNNNSVYNFSFSLKLKLGTGIAAVLGILIMYLRKGRVPKKKKEKDLNLPKECLNMSDHPVNGLMGTAIEKIRDMIDVNTIIGNPISTPEGATIIPVSKVSFGFASGGSDLPSKQQKELFGGAAGAGVSVQPLAFICVSPEGDVKLLQMSVNATKENAMISTLPELVDKISALVGKDGSKEKQKPKKIRTKEKAASVTDEKEN